MRRWLHHQHLRSNGMNHSMRRSMLLCMPLNILWCHSIYQHSCTLFTLLQVCSSYKEHQQWPLVWPLEIYNADEKWKVFLTCDKSTVSTAQSHPLHLSSYPWTWKLINEDLQKLKQDSQCTGSAILNDDSFWIEFLWCLLSPTSL